MKSQTGNTDVGSIKTNESKQNSANGINIWCSNCNRDLSGNKIKLIEEYDFEPLHFLQHLGVINVLSVFSIYNSLFVKNNRNVFQNSDCFSC